MPPRRTTLRNAFKDGLWARQSLNLAPEDQALYAELVHLFSQSYEPENYPEADLIHALAMNRIQMFTYERLELDALRRGDPLANLLRIRRVLDQLARTHQSLIRLIEERRHKNPCNERKVVEWIDPKTGKPWRAEPDGHGDYNFISKAEFDRNRRAERQAAREAAAAQSTPPPTPPKPKPKLELSPAPPKPELQTDPPPDPEPTPRPPGSALPPPTPLLNRVVNRLYFRYHRLQGNIAAYRFNRQRKAQLKKLHQTNAPPGRKAA